MQESKPQQTQFFSEQEQLQQSGYSKFSKFSNKFMNDNNGRFETNSTQRQQTAQNQNYTTSINELISEPIGQNIYSMEYVYQSLYQLSDYLWTKRIKTYYNRNNNQNTDTSNVFELSFDDYLLPLQQQLNKYDKFKKNKSKQEEKLYSMVASESKNNNNNSTSPTKSSSANIFSNKSLNIPSMESQLVKCYQQVPFIYFEENFSLNFSNFQDKQNRLLYDNTQKMKEQQEQMNDYLDLIEINLFGQIHRKFQDYFKAAANFDYLTQSINTQLHKLKQARNRVSRVQIQFVIKSEKLRKKIIERNNFQKLLKKIKIIKSLKKLPLIIQTILQSSLPYECLQLLKTTKKSLSQVENLKCVESVLNNIKSSETIVQLGLNKRYTDSLYLYIEETFRVINFQQLFKKTALQCPILDKQGNNSTLHNLSRRSQTNAQTSFKAGQTSFRAGDRSGFFVLEQLGEGKGTSSFNGRPLLKNVYAKRQQQKQYEIALILLQSYQYVDFPVDVTKIKISNGLRVISKKFQKDLSTHIKKQLQKSALSNERDMLNEFSMSEQNSKIFKNQQDQAKKNDDESSPDKIRQQIDRVSIEFYIKHIRILNQLFKESANRYLGYVLTLVTQYEEKLCKQITSIDKSTEKKGSTNSIQEGSEKKIDSHEVQPTLDELTLSKVRSLQKSQKMSKMQMSHNKFKQILTEELSVLPSIFKIIEQKLKYFLTLKNISNATPQQFFQWISLVRFWQRWFDVLIEESVLINYNCNYLTSNTQISSSTQLLALGQDMIEELINLVLDNIKKSISAMNIKNLITQLTLNYLNAYSSNVNSQLYQTILDQSWQSVQIPQQFSDVLNGILNKPSENQNMSITILNSSNSKFTSSFSNNKSNLELQNSALNTSAVGSQFKYKILKNNILIEGQRYKLTISFLLLCEFIEEFIRIGRLFEGITGQNDQYSIKQSKYIKKILSLLYDKIYELVDYYNSSCKQMILQKKALKMQKIKGANITVKHICLLSNCLTFLQKITKQIPLADLCLTINKKQRQSQTIYGLVNHNILLIDKISSILNKKMEQTVTNLKTKEQEKSGNLAGFHKFVTDSNQTIVTLFLQITQIIDEYLDLQKCQKILKLPFQLFVQKYFKTIILKGDNLMEEAKILLQKMKFLKKYFKNQFTAMQRQIQ